MPSRHLQSSIGSTGEGENINKETMNENFSLTSILVPAIYFKFDFDLWWKIIL